MMIETLGWIVLAVAIVLAFAVHHLTNRLKARNARLRRKYAAEFASAATKIAGDDEAPAALIDMLDAMRRTIGDRRMIWSLISWITNGGLLTQGAEAARANKELREFFERRRELEPLWKDALVGWFMSLSYVSIVGGSILRVRMHDRKELVGAARTAVRKSGVGNDNTPPPQAAVPLHHARAA